MCREKLCAPHLCRSLLRSSQFKLFVTSLQTRAVVPITLNIVIFVLRITVVLRANTGGDPRWAAYWRTRV
jgi:hypothetical protein